MIACYDVLYEDATKYNILWGNINFVMSNNGVPNVNFKGFMEDSAQANWNVVKKIYGDGEPTLPMIKDECNLGQGNA
jgi:hypothetical protein